MLIVIVIGLFLLVNFFYIHGPNPFLVAVSIVLALGLFLFAFLHVGVDGANVSLRFGIGLIRKKFPLADIASHAIVKNPWYYGWGIRRTPSGWLYNVSGLHAVEIIMKDGRKYRIGTNDPAGLDRAIGDAISGSQV